MRHRVAGRKFGLPSDQRKALLKSLVRALIKYGAIQTTETRAKDVRSIAEKIIADARVDSVHNRRMARRWLAEVGPDRNVRKKDQDLTKHDQMVSHLFEQVAPKFKSKSGGFTRMTKIGFRRGDAAPMVKLELAED